MITEKILIVTGATSAGLLAFIDPALLESVKEGPAILLLALLFGAQMYLNKLSADKQADALREGIKEMNSVIRSLTEHLHSRPCAWLQEHNQDIQKHNDKT